MPQGARGQALQLTRQADEVAQLVHVVVEAEKPPTEPELLGAREGVVQRVLRTPADAIE